jgi:hypothetical protein
MTNFPSIGYMHWNEKKKIIYKNTNYISNAQPKIVSNPVLNLRVEAGDHNI